MPRTPSSSGTLGRAARAAAGATLVVLSWPACADGSAPAEDWNAKLQSTYIWQHQPGFAAPYSGHNSLPPTPDNSHTFSFTAAFGKRLGNGAELYFDPEAVEGAPLSQNLVGLGGFYNGELTRVTGARLRIYRARLFVRQTWGQGGGRESLASDMNQLGGAVDRNRIVLTVGNFAVLDIFDANRYAHDPRTQFMNWCNMASCAFDYAADARGYTWGVALEDYRGHWAYRFGQFMQPRDPNGIVLDGQFFRHYGQVFEIEHAHEAGGQPGKIRLLAYRNRVSAGGFADAMASPGFATDNAAGIPATAAVRKEAVKYGLGYNAEQAIADDVGVFSRAMWQDGRYETYAFTEAHRSFSAGVALDGDRWARARHGRPVLSPERAVRHLSPISGGGRTGVFHRGRQAGLCRRADRGDVLQHRRRKRCIAHRRLPILPQSGLQCGPRAPGRRRRSPALGELNAAAAAPKKYIAHRHSRPGKELWRGEPVV